MLRTQITTMKKNERSARAEERKNEKHATGARKKTRLFSWPTRGK